MGIKASAFAGAALVLASSQPAAAETAEPVQAQPSPGSPTKAADAAQAAGQDDITVTGRKLTPQEYREKITGFVRETGVAAGTRPVARWLQPVCFKAVGLSDEQGARVEALLRTVATDAGVPIARQPCNTNVAVTFTDDAKSVVKAIQKRSPLRLSEMSAKAREAVMDGEAPVRWWYTTDVMSRYGAARGSSNPTMTLDGIGGNLPGADKPTMAHYTSSVVSTQVVRALQTATVVVDISKARGVPLETLGAYSALVAFAEINSLDAAPEGSILGGFKPGGARELTEIDMAFLKALYRVPLDREALAQRGMIVDRMLNRQE